MPMASTKGTATGLGQMRASTVVSVATFSTHATAVAEASAVVQGRRARPPVGCPPAFPSPAYPLLPTAPHVQPTPAATHPPVTGPVVTPALSQATAVIESSVTRVKATATAYFPCVGCGCGAYYRVWVWGGGWGISLTQ